MLRNDPLKWFLLPKPQKIFPRDKFIQALYAAMEEFDITSDNDRAGFLANIDHETGGFNGSLKI